jgi:hypothetical protein
LAPSMRALMRVWLPLASLVMMATGVVTWRVSGWVWGVQAGVRARARQGYFKHKWCARTSQLASVARFSMA